MRYSEEYNEWLYNLERRLPEQEPEPMYYVLRFAGKNKIIEAPNEAVYNNFVQDLVSQGLIVEHSCPLDSVDELEIDIMLDDDGNVIYEQDLMVCKNSYKSWPLESQIEAEEATGERRVVYWAEGENVWVMGSDKVAKPLPLEPSLKLRNHSPDGFAWGYYGSGPAQLALAILLYEYGNPVIASTYYQDFKSDIIAHFDKDQDWIIPPGAVRKWMASAEERHKIPVG